MKAFPVVLVVATVAISGTHGIGLLGTVTSGITSAIKTVTNVATNAASTTTGSTSTNPAQPPSAGSCGQETTVKIPNLLSLYQCLESDRKAGAHSVLQAALDAYGNSTLYKSFSKGYPINFSDLKAILPNAAYSLDIAPATACKDDPRSDAHRLTLVVQSATRLVKCIDFSELATPAGFLKLSFQLGVTLYFTLSKLITGNDELLSAFGSLDMSNPTDALKSLIPLNIMGR